jgi:hypothetical protein
MHRRRIATLARFATMGLGVTFGLYFVLTSPFQHDPLWLVWAPLVIAFTSSAGAVFLYGITRWTELTRSAETHVSIRDAAIRVTPIGIVIIFVLAWSPWLPAPMHFTLRFATLIAIPLLGGITAAGAMEGIRQVATRQSADRTRGGQAALVISLRQLLQRLLAALGSLVALSTLALGPSVNLLRKLAENPHFRVHQLPPQFVLVFGGLGSLLVAFYYAPAATAVQRCGQELCNDLFPLAGADDAATILTVAGDRHKLEQLLAVDRGVAADLQTGLVILGPFLASAATAFLSP